MEDVVYLSRADHKILREAFRPQLNFKRKQGLDVEPYVDSLIRKLAESHSQAAIAEILNERGILRNETDTWKQYHISRYFKLHGIKSVCDWRGSYERSSS